MADVATPSAVTMSTMDATAEHSSKVQKSRPEKPDEQQYKESLAKAEKEHAAAQEKVVRRLTSIALAALHLETCLTSRRMPLKPRLISRNL